MEGIANETSKRAYLNGNQWSCSSHFKSRLRLEDSNPISTLFLSALSWKDILSKFGDNSFFPALLKANSEEDHTAFPYQKTILF